MAEFKPIETQEQFDAMIASRLERAESKVRAEYADYEEIKTAKATLQTDFDNLKAENETNKTTIAELNTKITGLETNQLRTKIGLENNIPLEMISRLAGTTEEEIKADAEAMAKFIGTPHRAPLKSHEQNTANSKSKALKEMRDSLFETSN